MFGVVGFSFAGRGQNMGLTFIRLKDWDERTGEGEEIAPHTVPQNDEIAQFIARVERTDEAFQRQLSRAKVRALRNFYEMAVSQPPIPGKLG